MDMPNESTERLIENEIIEDSIEENEYGTYKVHEFKKSRSIWAIIFLMILYIILLVATLPLHYYCSAKSCALQASSLAIYCNVITLFITFLIRYFFESSNDKLWRHGYGKFYHSVVTISQTPFIIFSIGNGVLLLYVIILKDLSYNEKFDKIHFVGIQIIICIQAVLALAFLLLYLAKTLEFNASKRLPDVFDKMCHIQEEPDETRQTIGSKKKTLTERTLELQVDQIYYLENRCRTLTKSLHQRSLQQSLHLSDDTLLQA